MAHPMTLPTVGILALLGAGLGIHLGKASVAEISPHFFSEPPTRFHADLSPQRSLATSSGYVIRADMAGPELLGAGCIGCRDYPEEYYPQRDPAIDALETSYSDAEPSFQLAALEAQPAEDLALHRAKIDQVRRYAGLAETAPEQPAAQPAAADEASAVQGDEVLATE